MVVCLGLLVPAVAYTTEITVRRYAVDGLTPITETTKTYQWLEANLPVQGDGDTYYYYQGPIFENEWEAYYSVSYPEYRTNWGGSPPAWTSSEERWDRYWSGSEYIQHEEVNWQGKGLGKLNGTDVKDLCELVGGLPVGQKIRILAVDNFYQDLPYSAIYTPNAHLGKYVITWWSVGAGEEGTGTSGYTGPDYTNGMRGAFFADDSGNPQGEHVAGLGDMAEGLPSQYWYYYNGLYPSGGGYTVKYINRIYVFSNDAVPPPVADFSAEVRTDKIENGDFETGTLTPWTGSGATIYTGTEKKGSYSTKLLATTSSNAYLQQNIDFTGIGTINFWRRSLGYTNKYMQVLVDDTLIANFTETTTVDRYESIDISSYGFTGTHTLKFNAVARTGTLTVYLDDIVDYGPGRSGLAPLTVQFKDLSTKMQDPAHTSWAWDFDNDSDTDSTERNPLYTYPTAGKYTVKLTTTNAGGSDSEVKTDYIEATGAPTINIDTTGGITNWPFTLGTNEDTTSVDLSVTSIGTWTVSVKDARDGGKPAGTEGKMAEYNGGSYVSGGEYLTNALQVKTVGGSIGYVTLAGTDTPIQTGSGNSNYDIGLKQEIVAGDPALTAPNVYRIVVTFTGSTD